MFLENYKNIFTRLDAKNLTPDKHRKSHEKTRFC